MTATTMLSPLSIPFSFSSKVEQPSNSVPALPARPSKHTIRQSILQLTQNQIQLPFISNHIPRGPYSSSSSDKSSTSEVPQYVKRPRGGKRAARGRRALIKRREESLFAQSIFGQAEIGWNGVQEQEEMAKDSEIEWDSESEWDVLAIEIEQYRLL